MKKYELKKHSDFGFSSIDPPPSIGELHDFYENQYYQYNTGQYTKDKYTADEEEYFRIDCKILEKLYSSYSKGRWPGSLLDIGCGEGFQSDYFYKRSWNITCLDYSDFGLKNHHPQLLYYLLKGDCVEQLDKLIVSGKLYSLLLMKNVLEHVVNPINILQKVRKLMDVDSFLFIQVPNDFSSFQSYLLKHDYSENTWFCPPQHIHYFQFDSIVALLKATGFILVSCQAEFAIEQFLVNKHSNYSKDKNLGKEAHLARCKISNFLIEQDIEKYIRLREAHADLGFGRNILLTVKRTDK
jgi:2-polyprenyl-3-methyl-5-hydroxy-6-metoxy-1,4-benzoquinol methylase